MHKLVMPLAILSLAVSAGPHIWAESGPGAHTAATLPQAAKNAEQAGDLARLKGEYLQSAIDYQKALHYDPRNPQLYNKLGIADLKLNDQWGAGKNFKLALKYDPQNMAALTNLGALSVLEWKYKPAVRYLKKALALDESNAAAHVNLAEAWLGLKKMDRAMKEYWRALELDPDVLASSNDGVTAEVRTPQQEARIDFLIARAYAMRGNLDGALDYLQRAKNRLYPDLADVYKEKEFSALWNDPRLTKIVKR